MITVDITVNDLFGSVNAIMGLTSEKPDINYEDDGGYFHIRSVDTNNKD